jgi:deoxyhypusine synthase
MKKKGLLKQVITQVDATQFDSTPIINAMREMSFSSRDTARAADIF